MKLFCFVFILLVAVRGIVFSAEVFVAADTLGNEIGRGISMRVNDKCFILTPYHVVQNADQEVQITFAPRMTRKGYISNHFNLVDGSGKNVDLALIEVQGSDSLCLLSNLPNGSYVQHLLDMTLIENKTSSQILLKEADGGARKIDVKVLSFDPFRDIKIEPISLNDTLKPGMSGGALYINGKLAGILDSASIQPNIGVVMRLDYIYKWIQIPGMDQREMVAVFPFKTNALKNEKEDLTDLFRNDLVNNGEFSVMSKTETEALVRELQEQPGNLCKDFTIEHAVSKDCLNSFMRLSGASRYIYGSISRISRNTYDVSVFLIDGNTGNQLKMSEEIREGEFEQTVKRILANVASDLSGKTSQDHLDYLNQKEKEEQRKKLLEKQRFKISLLGFGYYPAYLLESDPTIHKELYIDSHDHPGDWGKISHETFQFGGALQFDYRLNTKCWLVSEVNYTCSPVKEGKSLINDTNTTPIVIPPDTLYQYNPSSDYNTTRERYAIYDFGIGLMFNVLQSSRIQLSFSVVPRFGIVRYAQTLYDSITSSVNSWVGVDPLDVLNGIEQTVTVSNLTGLVAGGEIGCKAELPLNKLWGLCFSINGSWIGAWSIIGTSTVHRYRMERSYRFPNMEVLDTTYSQQAQFRKGNYLGTGDYMDIINPEIPQQDINGNPISTTKGIKEFTDLRLSIGIVYNF